MDFATIGGILFGVICVVISILLGGSLMAFVDWPSVLIVFGGGIASVLISYRLDEVYSIIKIVPQAFSIKVVSPGSVIKLLVGMAKQARREGLLSLEASIDQVEDNFVKQSLQMVIDGVSPEIIKETMELELENLQMRHEKGQSLFKTMASLFPAWGMIGTLIGLINLLGQLEDPSKIGPSMAVALITTFYGSMLANFVCTPIANKLGLKSKEEVRFKEMVIEGMLSIQSGDNPKLLEHKLMTFMSPAQKKQYEEEMSNDQERVGEATSTIAG